MIDITQKILLSWPNVGYNGKDEKIKGFYSQLIGTTTNKHSIFYKKQATDVFIAAMALGKKAKIRKEFESGTKSRNIPKEVFNSKYVWMMIAVALEETDGDHNIFKTPEKIVQICEEYANYGIDELIKLDKNASTEDPFRGFEIKFQELLDELQNELPN